MAIDWGAGLSDLSGAVSSIFGGLGDAAEAKAYNKASDIAGKEAQYAAISSALQQTAAQRQVFQVIGGQEAQVGGAGLAESGSSLDLLRSSAQQGQLQKHILQTNGQLQVMGYQAAQAQYAGMAQAAKAASSGGLFGGLLKVASAFI